MTPVRAQAAREGFRVRGDSVPVWLILGIALAGLIGSIITAGILSPSSSDGLRPGSPRIETTEITPRVSPSVVVVGSGDASSETSGAPDLANDPDAKPGEVNSGPQVETDAGLAIEKLEAELDTSDTPVPDTGASGLDVVGGAAIGGPSAQLQPMQHPSGAQVPIQQATPETDQESLPAPAAIETPYRGESAPAASFQADPTKPGSQSAGTEAPEEATLEQTADEIANDCAPLFPIRFKHGSVKPQAADMMQKIESLAAWLNAHPTAILNLGGHADASGPEEYNLVLSFRRADAVAGLLEGAGTSKAQLVVRAYGEDRSSSHSTDPAFQRRVDLTIDPGTPCDEPSYKDGGLR